MKIIINNFKAITHSEIDFGKAFFLGNNGIGKTSVLEAIKFLFSGDYPESPIREGCTFANVSYESDELSFSRTIKFSKTGNTVACSINGKTVTGKELQATIREVFGGTEKELKFTSSTSISQMSSQDLGDILTQYISTAKTIEEIFFYLPELTEEEKNVVKEATTSSAVSMDDIKGLYETFVETRKFHKTLMAKSKSNEWTEDIPRPLKKVEEELAVAVAHATEAKAAKEALSLYNSAVEARAKHMVFLEGLEEKAFSITATDKASAKTNVEEEIKKLQSTLPTIQKKIALATKNIEFFAKAIESLDTKVCPLADCIICTTDKSAAISEMRDILDSNVAEREYQEEALKVAESQITRLTEQKTAYEEESRLYAEKVFLLSEIKHLRENTPVLPKKPKSVEPVGDSVSKLELERIVAGRYEAYCLAKKSFEEETEIVARYDNLCKYFSPKGELKTRIIEEFIAAIEKDMNNVFSKVLPYSLLLIAEAGVTPVVMSDVGQREIETLSTGEYAVFSVAVMTTLSNLSGFPVLLLDNTECIDDANFGKLLDAIDEKTVMIAGVDDDSRKKILESKGFTEISV